MDYYRGGMLEPRRKIFPLIFFLIVLLTSGCKEENNSRWEVMDSGIITWGDTLILVCPADFCEDNPFILGQGSNDLIWNEVHYLGPTFWSNTYAKQIFLEIPNGHGVNSFYYSAEELHDSLQCGVYYSGSYNEGKDDGYYRLRNGFISGVKKSGDWKIDYVVYFGGKRGDKYRMVKDAKY